MSVRLLIVGSCQTVGLRDCVAAALPDLQVEAVEVWNKTADQLIEVAKQVESCDLLLMHPLSDPRYAVVRSARDARNSGRRSFTIHRFVFSGTAPDCRYIGPVGRRLASPVMNHHSGRVLEAFLAGKTEAEAVAAFRSWSRTEVVSVWSQSRSQLVQREKAVDVKFVEELEANLAARHCFHVCNHPTIELLHSYAAKIVETLFPGTQVGGAPPVDRLVRKGSFPVYEAVREHFGLPYSQPRFTVGSKEGPVVMEVAEFVEKSYAIYRAQPAGILV